MRDDARYVQGLAACKRNGPAAFAASPPIRNVESDVISTNTSTATASDGSSDDDGAGAIAFFQPPQSL